MADDNNLYGYNLLEVLNNMDTIGTSIIDTVKKIQKALQPIQNFWEENKSRINHLMVSVARVTRPILAANRLGEIQYVYWDYFTEELVHDILESENLNKTLRERLYREKFKTFYNTVNICLEQNLMLRYKRIFTQSVFAFQNGQNDIAVMGYTGIIDGLLTDVSGNNTTSITKRVSAILEKLEQDEEIENDEFATFILMLTFKKTVDTFAGSSDFSLKEPNYLNRHWIMHGRSCKRKTKLDCVKLVNLIYGILLINELESSS